MLKLLTMFERIAQVQINTENQCQKRIKDRIDLASELQLERNSVARPPYSFMVCVAASTLIITFGLFCFTVRTFPSGNIRIEGPLGIRVDAQLGTLPIQEKPLPPSNHR